MSDHLRAIHAIKVGRRHRRDLGNIDALAKSISEHGLLHPIVIDEDNNLVAGGRRLEAVQRLGWQDVRVTVVNIADIARGEFAENMDRKDFTLSEAVAIKRVNARAGDEVAKGLASCQKLPRAMLLIRPPPQPAWLGARSKRLRQLWMRLKRSLISSASCSKTWIAAAA
jgi:ParB/RepB/Spo0J family partition protein